MSAAQRAPAEGLLAPVRGLSLPFAGLRLLVRERRLWLLAAVPLALSVAAVVGAASAVIAYAGEIQAWTSSWFPTLEGAGWSWLWVAPLRAVFFVLDKLLFAAVAALALVAAFVVASLLASPFHDALSRRVEEIVTGRVEERVEPGIAGALRAGLRALREEARRLAFFLSVWLALGALGMLVPGAQVLAGPALALFSVLFLPLDYTSYTFDRRGAGFADKRRWVRRHLGQAFGFGVAALAACAVPGLNLLALPVLVVAGTLLALRTAPALRAPGSRAGSSTSP